MTEKHVDNGFFLVPQTAAIGAPMAWKSFKTHASATTMRCALHVIADSIYQQIHVLIICVHVLMELELPVKNGRQMESVCVQFVIVDII